MGKPNGFLEYERQERKSLSEKERIKNFDEFHLPMSENEHRLQGARCMNCGVPFCQSGMILGGMLTGCPLHNLIPEWNDEIYCNNLSHAAARLLKTNNFPEFTGRVCPALCEKACICGRDGNPVTVRENELYVIENAFASGEMKPRIPSVRTEKKIAVIGSGPAGLAVADLLNRRGHNVTVFERDNFPGGLLMYGIPNMKLDKSIVARRIELMTAEGVKFVTNADVGKTISSDKILSEFDAVALCCGAKQPRKLTVAKESVKGIYFAVDFLSLVTKSLIDTNAGGEKSDKSVSESAVYVSAENKNVVIVGGGDTGNDCVGTCIRQGCKSVVQLEMMPCPPVQRLSLNPWPEWPKVLKTDYGQEEAIAVFGHDPRVYETTIKEIKTDEDGFIKSVITVKVKFVNENGKRVMQEINGSEKELPCELLLIAAGFTGCEQYTAKAFNASLTPRGVVATVCNSHQTENENVFTAGDMHTGQSLVVQAISEGRHCAAEIDKYLMGYSAL